MGVVKNRDWVMNFDEQGPLLGLLPRKVRFLGKSAETSIGMYEFEVVKGNAAYREGERFYLTPAQAQRAYSKALFA